jgi:hypothetical protein
MPAPALRVPSEDGERGRFLRWWRRSRPARRCGPTGSPPGHHPRLAGWASWLVLVPLGRRAQGDAVEPEHEAVPVQGIGDNSVTVLGALPRAWQQVRSIRHRLGAACDDYLAVFGRDLRGDLRDRSPDRYSLLTVMAGTRIGIPSAGAASRAGFGPTPAWITFPKITVSTWSPVIPAYSSPAAIAAPASSGAQRRSAD